MMLGELHHLPDPTDYDDPQWLLPEDPTDEILSSYSPDRLHDVARALQLYGRAGHEAGDPAEECDEFRMYEFKVRRCSRGRAHDWTECPYAHPGEKARRRDPRRHHYSAASCPEFRRGGCRKGDSCEFSHGVFECWLHPARYRTQPCKDGTNCTRRVCFFAHTPDQLRVVTPHHSPRSPKESPLAKILPLLASPSTVSPDDSPPISPMARSLATSSGSPISDMIMSLRNLQLERVRSLPRSYNFHGSGYVSPRSPVVRRIGFQSLPSTPTDGGIRQGGYAQCCWDTGSEDEPAMERVESGRSLRATMLEKLSRENSLRRTDANPPPDLDWVSDLVN